jgi:hypothetical protein
LPPGFGDSDEEDAEEETEGGSEVSSAVDSEEEEEEEEEEETGSDASNSDAEEWVPPPPKAAQSTSRATRSSTRMSKLERDLGDLSLSTSAGDVSISSAADDSLDFLTPKKKKRQVQRLRLSVAPLIETTDKLVRKHKVGGTGCISARTGDIPRGPRRLRIDALPVFANSQPVYVKSIIY